MKLQEKGQSAFTPHPETEAPVKAVIVDVTELKERQTQFGIKEEFRLVYETEVEDEEHDDRRFCVWSRGYTPSLNEKAAFRKDLKKILGRDLTQLELDEFDTEALIGVGVKLIIQHEHVGEKTYANISFLSADKDPLKPSGKYIRQRDREPKDGPAPAAAPSKAAPAPVAATSAKWEDVVIHVGKFKGKNLGEIDPADVQTLVDKWMPKATTSDADQALVKALKEVQALLTGDEY